MNNLQCMTPLMLLWMRSACEKCGPKWMRQIQEDA